VVIQEVWLGFDGLGAATPSRDIFAELSKLGYSSEYMQARNVRRGINYDYFDGEDNQIGKGNLILSTNELRELTADKSETLICCWRYA
jgi:hypothetical protein